MTAIGSHRLFTAVDRPGPVAAELCAWARAHRTPGAGLRIVDPDSIHLAAALGAAVGWEPDGHRSSLT